MRKARLLSTGERIPDYPLPIRRVVGRLWAFWFWLIPTTWMDERNTWRYRIWQTVVSQYGWWN
jgi:hypothetical protein